MTEKRGWTIAIQPTDDKPPRKITKILSLNGKGFSVLAPYHKARSGFIWKMPVPPNIDDPGTHGISAKSGLAFTAEDHVKLSYHTDGFAQFSGVSAGRITSGIDPETGEPKGIGLFTRPLTAPVSTGPSVGITVWGLEEFEEASPRDQAVIFRPDDLYYRACTPAEASTWIVSIYAFPINVVPPVRYVGGDAVFDIAADACYGRWFNVVRLKALHLRKEKIFLGAYVNALRSRFLEKSGWALHGPGTLRSPGVRGHNLMAFYPRAAGMGKERSALDRHRTDGTED
jgi:hypothetical protein